MRQPTDDAGELPRTLLGVGDAKALMYVLEGYIAYTRRTMPPSKRRDEEINLLERVRRQLGPLQYGQVVQVSIALSLEEIAALEHALCIFITLTRKNVARSPQRDQTLAALDELRRALARMRTQTLN